MNKKCSLVALLLFLAVSLECFAQNVGNGKNRDDGGVIESSGVETVNSCEIDRGIHRYRFIPKGQWLVGGAFSYAQNTSDNYKFVVLEKINGDNYTFTVTPYFGYFIKDNFCIGGRFSYKRSLLRIDNLNLNINDDLNFDVKDYYSLQHIYTGAFMMRNYMSLGDSRRFGLFNEIRLSVGGGQGKVLSGKEKDLTGTFENIFELGLGISPGLVAFITNDVAIEASVNVMGFNYKKHSQTTDQIYKGEFESSKVNFKVDLFSINIGVSFHVPYINPLKRRTIKRNKLS